MKKTNYIALVVLLVQLLHGQSKSVGNIFISANSNLVIHSGLHHFDQSIENNFSGVIGTVRDENIGIGVISFANDADWINASNFAHVDGYVRSYKSSAFLFPVGDNSRYRPVVVSGATVSHPVDVAYFGVNPSVAITSGFLGGYESVMPLGGPFSTSSLDVGIQGVSSHEYWDINGNQPAQISLTWDSNSQIELLTNNDLSKLTILGWDGLKWVKIDSSIDTNSVTGGVSSFQMGSITTTTTIIPNNFSVYTFGSKCSTIQPGTIIGENQMVLNSSQQLTVINGALNGMWTSLNSEVASITSTGVVNTVTQGTATFQYTVDSGGTCPNSATTFTIHVIYSIEDIDGDGILNPADADADGDGIIENGPDSNNNGINDIYESENDGVKVYNLITPNGDGLNDVLTISNITNYPENSLEIMNRWGAIVYSAENYGQNGIFFRGYAEGKNVINSSEGLPVGTYWYILRYKVPSGRIKEKVGYLYINK